MIMSNSLGFCCLGTCACFSSSDHLWCEFVLLSLTKVCPPCRLVLKFVHPAGLLPWDNTPGENSSLLVWMAVEQPYLQSADGDQKEPIPTIPLFHCPVCFWMILLWTVFGKNVAISPLSLGVRALLRNQLSARRICVQGLWNNFSSQVHMENRRLEILIITYLHL